MTIEMSGVVLAVSLAASALGGQAPAQGSRSEVPVKTVILYSSGVGYFEHAGNVRGDGSTELRFKTAQINDVLKSLVLQDMDGGRVTTITYPSQDPLAKTLRSFQVDITSNPGMASLLNQLRGAKVTTQYAGERISGTILGVETRQRTSDKGDIGTVSVLNLLTGAMIRSLELPSLTSLSIDDPQLQDELTKALSALTQSRDQDKKPVTINFSGSGDRRVRIGYVVETPIWKTSYRLIMDDKEAKLQGWAIVENQTESDWNNVSLSLVSGRPISFIMDLYQPLYLMRPTVVPELFAGLRPQSYSAGIDGAREVTMMTPPAPSASGGRGGGAALVNRNKDASAQTYDIATNAFEDVRLDADYVKSVNSAATTAKLGELFQYAIPNVTLARQKSAMLPIVTDAVGFERLSIYNASVLPRNPLNGVRLKNTTGKHLLQGPVTVLDANSYAGDARIDNVPPGQERLLSYGVDLELVVDNTKNSSTSQIVSGKIVKGLLTLSRRTVATQEYQVDNKGSRNKTILIEHPIRAGWKLTDTQQPKETTATLYRFEGTAIAGKVTVLPVKEELVRQESVAMLPSDMSTLILYSKNGEISQLVRDAIGRAVTLRQLVLDTEAQVSERTDQINDITQEQERMRENMKTVDSKSTYYTRLLTKLNEQETTIERLQKERDSLMLKRDAQRKELENYLATLNVG